VSVSVFSEIAPLQRVVVHAPGPEVDTMLPEMMHRLLFDDIIHGVDGRQEHRQFRAILKAFGVEVLDSLAMLGEALQAEPTQARALIDAIQQVEGLTPDRVAQLADLDPITLSRALVEGLPLPGREGDDARWLSPPLPIPNLLFSRDAAMSVGEGVVIGAMASPARQREPLLLRFITRHHPLMHGAPILLDLHDRVSRLQVPGAVGTTTLEGGDVLVLQEGIVCVGVSERTMAASVDRLVDALREDGRFRAVVLVQMPAVRHAMHLDTIFTRLSDDQCLVFAPMIVEGHRETIRAVAIELTRKEDYGRRFPSVLAALRHLGVHLEPLYCGGRDSYVQQAREQWTDGANSFAIAPGVVVLYGRNRNTAEELHRHGYEVVEVAGLRFDEDGRVQRSFLPGKRYALLLEGHELSRARGGPRCMTMPLVREA